MANSSYSNSFHIIASPSSSLPSIAIRIDFIYNSFISLNLCYVCRCSLIIVHWILQDQDSGSSSDDKDILVVPKFHKLLSGEIYHKKMFDESGQLLYPTNPNMPYSNNHPRSMVLHCEFDLFYVDNNVGHKKNMFE